MPTPAPNTPAPHPLAASVERALARLRRRGEPVAVVALAQELLRAPRGVPPAVARRVVATALGYAEAELPDPLPPGQLRAAEEAAVAAVRLEEADFAVVDLETTGLSAERDAILEIGAVRIRRLCIADRFQTLVRTPHAVPRRITDLTGIDDSMLAEAPASRPALEAFRRWLARTPRALFVAHNASFDARFTRAGFRAHGLTAWAAPVLCTRRLARRLLPRLGRYNLDHLCAHFGIPNRARHRALGDADATACALLELLQLALPEAPSVGDLLDLQARPPTRRRRRRPGSQRRGGDADQSPRGRSAPRTLAST